MQYDPIKNIFGAVVRYHPFLRKVFYKILGIMFLREWYVKRQLRQLLQRMQGAITIYDAGCGFGQYSYYLATHFPNVSLYSVDVKDDQIKDCSEFFNAVGLGNRCVFKAEDLTRVDHENKFDLILSVDVMEHIQDDEKVFQNFYRALKPNGYLLVNTPSDQGGSDVHKDDDESFIGEHARVGYNIDELKGKLQSIGFSIESVEYAYGTWGMVAWRLGIKIPMVLLDISKIFFILLPFYYIIVLPFFLLMMLVDFLFKKTKGAGLLVVAQKKIV